MNPKKKAISLYNLKRIGKSLDELSQTIFSNLNDEILELHDPNRFLYRALKQIYPINIHVKDNSESIENACQKVVEHFYGENAKDVFEKGQSYSNQFCNKVLNINLQKLPAKSFQLINNKVTKDLLKITELIDQLYRTNTSIRNWEETGQISGGMPLKMLDFYLRCINEREEILKFQLYDLKNRAISKSKNSSPGLLYGLVQIHYDRPYRFAASNSTRYFDYTKIDQVRFRLDHFYLNEIESFMALYEKNKVKFYEKYFEHISKHKHLKDLSDGFKILPFKNDRKAILTELKKLFKNKNWIGFYTLATTQVEGIFSEMCDLIDQKDFSSLGLVAKVRSVRDFHHYNDLFNFDYYQYIIPERRNILLHIGHTGKEKENFELLSNEILVDLCYLLRIFRSLNAPLVEITEIIEQKKPVHFINIANYASYFRKLDAVKKSKEQWEKHKTKIEKFEKEFLNKECEIEQTCQQLILDMPDKIARVQDHFDFMCVHQGVGSINFSITDNPKIRSFLKDEKKREVAFNFFAANSSVIQDFNAIEIFLKGYVHHLPSLKQATKDALRNSCKQIPVIERICYMNNQVMGSV